MSERVPRKLIYCCQCGEHVRAELTTGAEVYPTRTDLAALPIWICRACGNYVGCHWKTADPTRPLGAIPSPAVREARQHIHRLIDPVWKKRLIDRKDLYAKMSRALGYRFHTAEITSVEQARHIYRVAKAIIKGIRDAAV